MLFGLQRYVFFFLPFLLFFSIRPKKALIIALKLRKIGKICIKNKSERGTPRSDLFFLKVYGWNCAYLSSQMKV